MPDLSGSLDGFWKFVALRQEAYWAKVDGAKKWDFRDATIASHHFPNVFRELDRGTRYFQQRLDDDDDRSLANVLWRSLTYRPINAVGTFALLGWPEKDFRFLEEFGKLSRDDKSGFTSRHQVRGYKMYAQTYRFAQENSKVLASDLSTMSLEKAFGILVDVVPGLGNFFAWQVACDLLESKCAHWSEDDWVRLGPGAARGMVTAGFSTNRSNEVGSIRAVVRSQDRFLGPAFRYPAGIPRFTMKNVEHALCEYQRYCDRWDKS